ncbi:aspartyl protease family protein [Flavobacterium sp.]|uniref:aspartyl protease family protein n=1 Tax=Flavobacterium sp. TaxID=239 RepID=UPI001B6AFB97|nr:aspartyl protease family protein [Flavobacterium sp.]MBP6181531.1 aspartyl protease family protein [Flavobacterium sp.]
MKKIIILFFLLFSSLTILAQDGFKFTKKVDKVAIPFKFINNLIFIPIKVNGVELNFLLDTGVEETILFSLEDKKEITFSNVEKITLRGLGSEDAVEGLKSTNNILETRGLKASNHLVYIVLDQEFNLSSYVGIPVNGIIGYQFFKNNIVEIDYGRRSIIVHRGIDKNRNKLEKKFQKVVITIERLKPYIINSIVIDSIEFPVKLLIDIGNSDGIWLFENSSKLIKVPPKNFEDYLGKGFSGDIEGRKAKVSKFKMSKFEFNNPIAAFPDSISIRNVKMVPGRVGSVGGEILRRFSVVFDYTNGFLYLKKNKEYYSPFNYNKSGVEIQHHGLQWVQETISLNTVPTVVLDDPFTLKTDKNASDFKYKFKLKPVYEIANIRKKSPAANSGLQKGDILVSINKNLAYKYSLQEINSLFRSEEENWITLEIQRNGQIHKFRFQLQNIL